MNRTTTVRLLVFVVLAVSAAHFLWATDEQGYAELDLFDLILSIIENPDPIAQVHWIDLFLDPNDPNDPNAREPGQRNDGRPVFEFDRVTREPVLAWAYDTHGDHDIAFNGWEQGDWISKIEFISSLPVNERDPRLYVDQYNHLYLTWWEDTSNSRMMLARREQDSRWTIPMPIGMGRRPSVAVSQHELVFAFERDNGHTREIVFARSEMGGTLVPEVVGVTDRTERLDPIVHVRDGRMWIDWKHSDQTMAVTIYENGNWSTPQLKDWTDPSWFGELLVRHEIENAVIRQTAPHASGLLRRFGILPAWANWNMFGTSVSSPTSMPVRPRLRSGSSTTRE